MTTATEHQQHAKTLRRFQRRVSSMMTANAITAAMFPHDRTRIVDTIETAAEYHERCIEFMSKQEPEGQEGDGMK